MKKKTRNLVAIIMLAFILVGITGGIAMLQHSMAAPGQFDPIYYAQTYPDVAVALGTDATVLYNHYITYGQKEGRIPYAGGQPGEAVNGIAGTTAQTQPQAPATTGQLQTATGLPLPSPENPIIVSPCTGSKYDLVYDLSNWTAAQWDYFYKKQAEFDASEYAKVGWTEAQVQERLLSLKEMYPEGTVVGTCGAGAGKIQNALYGNPRDWTIGYDKNEQQVLPIGFVYLGGKYRKDGNLKDIVRVGDILYTKGPGQAHVSVVLSRDDYGITVVDSNWNNDEAMHWGYRISWNELENGGPTIYQEQNKWSRLQYAYY